jgi:hypothetical protein
MHNDETSRATGDATEPRPGAWRVIVRAIRDGWIILGITLALFVVAELAYRGQGALRRSMRGESFQPALTGHPYEHEAWFAAFDPNRPQRVAWRYDPYRGWWPLAYAAPGITVDSTGLRLAGHQPASRPARRVFLFGGSAAWGYAARDEHTIAAALERALETRGLEDIDVVNFGQSSYNATQETITLLLELRDGNVPDVVVFFDGNNDVSATFQNGVAGMTLNQPLAADRWRAGRSGVLGQVADLTRHSLLMQRLQMAVGRAPVGQPVRPAAGAVCRDVAEYYRNLTRTVNGLAHAYDFRALFIWQPMLATSRKTRSAWERQILEWAPGYDALVRECTASVDSLMANERETQYVPMHSLFDSDTATVFVDNWGHTTERANHVIAHRIAELLAPALSTTPRRPNAAAGGAASLSLAPDR